MCRFHSLLLLVTSCSLVRSFKYLGHVITDTLSDDGDLQREIRSLFTRTDILARRFAKQNARGLSKLPCVRRTVFVSMMLVCSGDTSPVHLTNYLPATINV